MHHSLQFLIDLTFNLSLVEEFSIFDMKRVESMLKLVLSTERLPKLSFMPLQPACLFPSGEAETSTLEKRPQLIRRGRDQPFPAPVRRRRSDSSTSENKLLHRRYTRPTPAVVVTPPPQDEDVSSDSDSEEPTSRGRTLQRETRLRRDSGASSLKYQSPTRSVTNREYLLRVPGSPLPRRTVPSHSLEPSLPKKERPASRRVSSIPPPLNLPPGYIQRMDEESDYDSDLSAADIRPEPQLLQARRARRQRSCRPAPLLSGGYF